MYNNANQGSDNLGTEMGRYRQNTRTNVSETFSVNFTQVTKSNKSYTPTTITYDLLKTNFFLNPIRFLPKDFWVSKY